MKKEIKIFDYAEEIIKALEKGVLLTTKVNDKINSMAISWGTLGIEWGKPIFTVFVREHRFTHEQLDQSMEFTINIPRGEYNKKIIGICGSKSGRDIDKISETGLTVVAGSSVGAPAFKEFPLTLECKVIYRQAQEPAFLGEENRKIFHPQDVPYTNPMANCDYHTAYYGEIVHAYIVE